MDGVKKARKKDHVVLPLKVLTERKLLKLEKCCLTLSKSWGQDPS